MLPTNQPLTFLFTDIEGSAALWEQYPTSMPAALAAHDALLHAAVAEQGGQVVKRTGDGLMAVFASQHAGIAAALSAQRQLLANASQPELKVRMGLHCGTAMPRDGDYFGTEVNRAARLMALASGGQVLISEECAAPLLANSHESQLLDLGRYHLKGFLEPQQVFQLLADDLPRQFPPLTGGVETPHNLPARLTGFVGREKQLGELDLLFTETASEPPGSAGRLITLIGPGGTGKTRLSIEIGHKLLPLFPDGVWLVELAPLREPVQVSYAIASVLGLQETPGLPIEDLLIAHLRQRKTLVILDNCEHMVEVSADLAEALLQGCPRLGLLASSREALGVSGERVYRVPSLDLPAADENEPEQARASEAVRLLLARGQAVNQSFELTRANTPAVVQICRRLDGIPLALELAAVRLSAYSAEQIAARLDDRFRLLTGGSRTALPRQQTLHALIDWSYELLGPDEKALLRQLSVFVGGWSLEAAEAVSPHLNVLDLLPQLVDKSLVVREEEDNTEPRYRLLETIRQFARDHLTETGEAEASRDRHLAYYKQLTESAEQNMLVDHQLAWYALCEREYENYRAAIDWGLLRDPLLALELASAISFYWSRVGFKESSHWLRATLQAADGLKLPDPQRLSRAKLRALQMLASDSIGNMPPAESLKIGAEALEVAQASSQLEMLGYAYGINSFIAIQCGDFISGEKYLLEASNLLEQTNDLPPGQIIYSNLLPARILLSTLKANLLLQSHQDIPGARQAIDACLELIGERQMPFAAGVITLNKIQLERYAGNAAEVLPLAQTTYQLLRRVKDQSMANIILAETGHIYRQIGDIETAFETYCTTIRAFAELQQLAAVAHQLECFAFIAIQSNDSTRAARLFGAAEAIRNHRGTPMTPTEAEEYTDRLALLKTALPDEEFKAAWAEGTTLDLDAAVRYACTTDS